MKEKIIALLTAKFAGTRKDTLAQIARMMAMQATTEEEAQALVDAITKEQVTEFEREFRADVDREVTAGQKAHEGNLDEWKPKNVATRPPKAFEDLGEAECRQDKKSGDNKRRTALLKK